MKLHALLRTAATHAAHDRGDAPEPEAVSIDHR